MFWLIGYAFLRKRSYVHCHKHFSLNIKLERHFYSKLVVKNVQIYYWKTGKHATRMTLLICDIFKFKMFILSIYLKFRIFVETFINFVNYEQQETDKSLLFSELDDSWKQLLVVPVSLKRVLWTFRLSYVIVLVILYQRNF